MSFWRYLDCFQSPVTKGPTVLGMLFTIATAVVTIVFFVSLHSTNRTAPDISTASSVDYSAATSPVYAPFQCLAPLGCIAMSAFPNGPCQGLPSVSIPYGATSPIPACFLNADTSNNAGTVILGVVNNKTAARVPVTLGQVLGSGFPAVVGCSIDCDKAPVCNTQLSVISTERFDGPAVTRYYTQSIYACPDLSVGRLLPCTLANISGEPNHCVCTGGTPESCTQSLTDEPFTVGSSLVLAPVVTHYKVESGRRSTLSLFGETGGAVSLLVALFSIIVLLTAVCRGCCSKNPNATDDQMRSATRGTDLATTGDLSMS